MRNSTELRGKAHFFRELSFLPPHTLLSQAHLNPLTIHPGRSKGNQEPYLKLKCKDLLSGLISNM